MSVWPCSFGSDSDILVSTEPSIFWPSTDEVKPLIPESSSKVQELEWKGFTTDTDLMIQINLI